MDHTPTLYLSFTARDEGWYGLLYFGSEKVAEFGVYETRDAAVHGAQWTVAAKLGEVLGETLRGEG